MLCYVTPENLWESLTKHNSEEGGLRFLKVPAYFAKLCLNMGSTEGICDLATVCLERGNGGLWKSGVVGAAVVCQVQGVKRW